MSQDNTGVLLFVDSRIRLLNDRGPTGFWHVALWPACNESLTFWQFTKVNTLWRVHFKTSSVFRNQLWKSFNPAEWPGLLKVHFTEEQSSKHQNWQKGCPCHGWHFAPVRRSKGQRSMSPGRSSHHLQGRGHIVAAVLQATQLVSSRIILLYILDPCLNIIQSHGHHTWIVTVCS